MRYKIFFFVTLFTALIVLGCNDESVAPLEGSAGIISGETKLIEVVDPGTVLELGAGKTQVLNQVAIFRDSSSNAKFSGLRNVVLNITLFTSSGQENSYGTFSLKTNSDELWEGDWTGHTTSSGTAIEAVGYNNDEKGKSCVWNYYFPSSNEGKVGRFTARIINERD